MPSPTPVLVFGPTGGVGSSAALTAHRLGAHVYLAMRDTNKSVRGLSNPQDGFTRVQADLSDPKSLTAAVQTSGAKSAFVYVLHQSPDHMTSAFAALKDAGIEYVVLLSSYTVKGDPTQPENHVEYISALHAKTEEALRDSGLRYTAVRPAFFNTNVLWYVNDLKQGKVHLVYPETSHDYIAPSDIGTIAGKVLIQQPEESHVLLCGPELLTQYEAYSTIGKVLGKDVEIIEVDEEGWKDRLSFMPRPVLDTVANGMRKSHEGKSDLYKEPWFSEAVGNLRKWLKEEGGGTKFGQWVGENKELFA
ncbi:hypothetical protein FB567DRAFT_529041 [Paraphoma chrysanthemicola]|uniref:NmrA-like domain-containing protein n=1 Tax=Paraphoma chrysanthemicola TaxID=798071 RepID=A0A8K0VXC1_9PLEO|nr:hypothetical protein FB567DRAFT_529041 [Paraphoma chrysanthemicola]